LFIYVLSDPETGAIRYVGKTERSLKVRKNEHRSLSKHRKTHLYCWWRSLKAEPILEVVEEYETATLLNEAECFWIDQFRALGFDLVNHTAGGEGQVGLKHTEDTKLRISRARGGRSVQDQFSRVYPTVSAAAQAHNLHQGNVWAIVNGRAKSIRGLAFTYLEPAHNLSI
jgi:hypothetical protein